MAADDFLRPIALDALRAEVPIGDVALRIEHADGVVGDALHQEPELLLAELEPLFGQLAFGEVARDLGVANKAPGRGPDRIDHNRRPEPGAILADAPAFIFELARSPGSLQGARRKPRVSV